MDLALSGFGAKKVIANHIHIEYMNKCMHYKDICSSSSWGQIQRVIAKRTSQIMKYGQDVIIQKRTDDDIRFGKWY